MTEPRFDREPAHDTSGRSAGEPRYPTNHVVGTLGTPEETAAAVAALIAAGVDRSEIEVIAGADAADALEASTGRRGLANLAIRIAERLGVRDHEMALKDDYEQALRDGECLVTVPAPDEERKLRAAEVLREHGGKHINFMGRFTIEPDPR